MSHPDPSIWRDMIAYLRTHHADMSRQWFDELEPIWFDGGVLQVRVQSPVQKNYLASQCAGPFNDAIQAATGNLVTVRFVSRETEPPPVTMIHNVREPQAQPGEAFGDQIIYSPDYTFENFVTGPQNHLAYAASCAVAQQPGYAYNPFFIHGGVGLGKTHLLQAICQTVLMENPKTHICYLSCDEFINHFIDAVSGGNMHDFRHRYRHVDMLVIDDIHFLAERDRTQEEFFHTFNTLFQAKKQIILSSDSPPSEIPKLEERLVSRFNWGLVARVDKPCYETRVAIIRKKAELRGLEIPDEIVCYIASKIESNTRELEGAITKVLSMSTLTSQPISMELARNALGDEVTVAEPQLSIQSIIDAVIEFYGVKLSDLQSKRRHRSITIPRQVCMYLARKRTNYSLEEIGGYFGGRDHTTVMHAIRTIDERVEADQSFASQVTQIDQVLVAD